MEKLTKYRNKYIQYFCHTCNKPSMILLNVYSFNNYVNTDKLKCTHCNSYIKSDEIRVFDRQGRKLKTIK